MSEKKDSDFLDEQIRRVERATHNATVLRTFAESVGVSPFVAGMMASVAGSRSTREAASFLLAEELYKKGEAFVRALRPSLERVESQDSAPSIDPLHVGGREEYGGSGGTRYDIHSSYPAAMVGKKCPHGFTILAHGTCDCPECP